MGVTSSWSMIFKTIFHQKEAQVDHLSKSTINQEIIEKTHEFLNIYENFLSFFLIGFFLSRKKSRTKIPTPFVKESKGK